MKIKNPDKIAAFEKAIKNKYGYDAIQNPNANWDEEKEREYIESSKKFQTKVSKYNEDNDLVETDGFLMPKRLLNSESNRTCPTCSTLSPNGTNATSSNRIGPMRLSPPNLTISSWVNAPTTPATSSAGLVLIEPRVT